MFQVELMGGRLTVSSKEHVGSTFTFILPYKVSIPSSDENSDDTDELSDVDNNDAVSDDLTEGFFQFQPRTLGSLFSSNGSTRRTLHKFNGFPSNPFALPSPNGVVSKAVTNSVEDSSSVVADASDLTESTSSSDHRENSEGGAVKLRQGCGDSSKEVNNESRKSSNKCEGLIMKKEDENSRCVSRCSGSREEDSSKECCRSKPKILLVEDNKINVMVTQSMMKRLGYSMDVVNNGVEAVKAVQRHTYDIILMDVFMPVMNGLQTTKLIRSYEETGNWDAAKSSGIEQIQQISDYECCVPPRKRIHIIAMTANTVSESAEECYANGMDSFVSKPVTFQKLKECLEQYLR
ncbi:hypothetical protein PIB30_030041 [Stylosanthes scabra]|uniref:Response regulatory domain-containing protein n=1 Tax=Stylosanthes scabra TaxID=79078 RepID=A0ABU6SBR2_9FABA|nr:hypothetical protein [Stylosanthes scabra]